MFVATNRFRVTKGREAAFGELKAKWSVD